MLTHYQTRIVCGVELSLCIEFNPQYDDQSFDHAFGTEHCGEWIVEESDIDSISVDGNLRDEVTAYLREKYPVMSRKSFLKRLRRLVSLINHELDKGSPYDVLDMDELQSYANQNPPEPDNEPDYGYEDRWIDAAYEARFEMHD